MNAYCPQCNSSIQFGAEFCDNCGKSVTVLLPNPIPPPPTPPQFVASAVCVQCQASIMFGEAFCDKCGAPNNIDVTKEQSNEFPEQYQIEAALAALADSSHIQEESEEMVTAKKEEVSDLHCTNCAAAILSGEAVCGNCGASIGSPTPPAWSPIAPPSPPSPTQTHVSLPISQTLAQSTMHLDVETPSLVSRLWHFLKSWWQEIKQTKSDQSAAPPSTPDSDKLPFTTQFRFIHEPYVAQAPFAYIGREGAVNDLAHRILFSSGGAILVTGYRGVGKTSFVNRAVEVAGEQLFQQSTQIEYEDLLYIQFNLARQMAPDEIMHHIIRRTYQALIDHGLMPKLSKDTQRLVDLAYQRTSFSISQKIAASHSTQAGVSLPQLSMLGTPSTFSVNRGWTRSNEEALTFLGYDDKAAEFDVIQLLHHLVHGQQKGWWPRKPIKVVIAFDELDKISNYVRKDDKLVPNPYIDHVVSALKTVLTTSGVVFIFIAGRDFHQRWQADLRRTDSVYDSVFAHQIYLPCAWDFPKKLIKTYQHETSVPQTAMAHIVAGYLRFHSRGITRRAYRSINQMVFWENDQPFLALSRANRKRLQFYHELDNLLGRYEPQILSPIRERANLDLYQDEYRSYTYRLVDTIIESAGRDFTGLDLLQIGREEIPLLNEYELANLTNIVLDIMLDNHYIQRVGSRRSGFAGLLAPEQKKAGADPQRYRLADSILVKMNDLDLQENQDNVIIGVTGNYDLLEKINEGGFAEVYKARDRRTVNQIVVIKQAKKYYSGDLSPIDTLRNEARLLTKLAQEENLPVALLHEDKSQTEPAYLALEFIDGINLKDALALVKGFRLEEVLALIPALAAPVSHIHELEIFQLDIKPANFILTRQGDIYLVDLGSALDLSVSGQQKGVGLRVGTLEYAAPELKEGHIQSLELTDIYSFGAMIYELLFGSLPSDNTLAKLRSRLPEKTNIGSENDSFTESVDKLVVNQGKLRRLIINYFSEGELKDICFDMQIDFDGLPGTGKWAKARELVELCLRTDRLQPLLSLLHENRPKVSWDVFDKEAQARSASNPKQNQAGSGFQSTTTSRATQKLSEVDIQKGYSVLLDALAQAMALSPQQRFGSISDFVAAVRSESTTSSFTSTANIAHRIFNLEKELLQEERHATRLLNEDMIDAAAIWSNPGALAWDSGELSRGKTLSSLALYAPPTQAASTPPDNTNFTARLSPPTGVFGPPAEDLFGLIDWQTSRVYPLEGERITVGRMPSNDIVLNHDSVSRQHTLFEYRPPGQWVVINLQSANGTFVNGRRLESALPLKMGDVIRIGQFEFSFDRRTTSEVGREADASQTALAGVIETGILLNTRYEVKQVIGQGGMSRVYLAFDRQMNMQVAVKQFMSHHFPGSNELREMRQIFNNEISVLERLNHPHIVRLFNHFHMGPNAFYVMEYVKGQTAENIINQTTGNVLSEALVLKWTKQICDALNYLHERSIIYRDMKPANIMVTTDNTVKLLDFGTARYFKQDKKADTTKLGTPGYAAPEQYGGEQTDASSDVYALGSTIHYLITGQDPDSRSTPFDIASAQELNPQISKRTSDAITKATNQDRKQRFQSVKEFWKALDPDGT